MRVAALARRLELGENATVQLEAATSVEQYRPQFADETLTGAAYLIAIEPYGHGQTRASYR